MLNAKRQKTNYFLTKRYVLRHCRYAISPRDIFRSLRIFHIIFLSFKSTKITVDSKTLKTSNHRCRSRQNFGDAKDFYPNSPKLARKKTPNKSSPCHFGRHFFKSKHVGRHFCSYIRDFVKVFRDFVRILRDFHQIKLLGVSLHPMHPRLLHQCFKRYTVRFGRQLNHQQ